MFRTDAKIYNSKIPGSSSAYRIMLDSEISIKSKRFSMQGLTKEGIITVQKIDSLFFWIDSSTEEIAKARFMSRNGVSIFIDDVCFPIMGKITRLEVDLYLEKMRKILVMENKLSNDKDETIGRGASSPIQFYFD